MNIAVLSLHLPSPARTKSGGVAYVAHRLANGFCERGHAVTVFSTDARPPDARYQVHHIPAHFSPNVFRNWLQNWRVAREFAAQDFTRFDIIHAHGDDALLWRQGLPIVRTFHGAALGEAIHATTWRKRLWYLSFVPREVWEATKGTVAVAVSANTRRYIPFVDRVIPNSVDQSIFFAGQEKSPHPTVLFVGTLSGRKRGKMLVELFESQIRPALPEAELWLVAEEPVEAPAVVSFQQPDERTLAELYRRAWVFCLPSTYEGFGIPYIEAMACGTPVVATPNPGACEVLGDGRWGIIASPPDLAPTLLSLLNDVQMRERWSRQGLERARDFSLDRILDAYESLFQDTIQLRRRR